MISQSKQRLLALAVVSAALAAGQIAQAQNEEQPDEAIEEILVTATKRGPTTTKETPLAISAVSGSQLDWRDSRDFTEFALLLPSVQFQDLGPGDKEYILRGVNANGPASVGAYFDEVVITANDSQDGGGKNADIYLTDMERIEVLNGPQGTLYGANSMSGTVRFITRKPDAEAFDANFTLNFGTTDGEANTNLEGMVNLPVGDSAAVRLVGWFKDTAGWIDQPLFEAGPRENINTNETTGFRAMFRYATESFRVDLMALTQDTEVGGTSRYTESGTMNYCGAMSTPEAQDALTRFDAQGGDTNNPLGPCETFAMGMAPHPSTAVLVAPFTPASDFQNTDLVVTPWEDQTDLFSATVEFDIGAGSLTATTGNYDRDIFYSFDSTWILLYFGVPFIGPTQEPQTRSIASTEVRYASDWGGPVEIVAGVFLHDEESVFTVYVTTTDRDRLGYPRDPVIDYSRSLAGLGFSTQDFYDEDSGTLFNRMRTDTVEQQAFYGEATIELTPDSDLIVGLRNFSADLTSAQTTPVPFGAPRDDRNITSDDSKTTFKLTYHKSASEQLDWYLTWSQGFRVGGINNVDQPFQPGTPVFFNSDSLDNLEAGFKFLTSDRRWAGEVAAFFMQWSDIQVEPRDPGSAALPYIFNGGTADILGLEASVRFNPSDSVSISFGGSWTDAALAEDQPLVRSVTIDTMDMDGDGDMDELIPTTSAPHINQGKSGDAMPNVPEIQLFATLDLNWMIGGRPLRIGVEAAHRGATESQFRTDSPFNISIDAYTLINFRVAYQVAENWRVSASVHNVTDELAVFDTIFNSQEAPAVVGARPQTIGFALDYRF